MNYNKTQIAGNLTRDWELRYIPKGKAVAENAIAVNRKWKDENGQQREETEFFDVQAWGKSAETLQKIAPKGTNIFIDGRLKVETWRDWDTGARRSKIRIIVEGWQFAGSKRETSAETKPSNAPSAADYDQEEIPF